MMFRCFVEKNIKLTFGYPGETNKLYWEARNYNRTKTVNVANLISNRLEIPFHLRVNLHECSAEVEIGNVAETALWLFLLLM